MCAEYCRNIVRSLPVEHCTAMCAQYCRNIVGSLPLEHCMSMCAQYCRNIVRSLPMEHCTATFLQYCCTIVGFVANGTLHGNVLAILLQYCRIIATPIMHGNIAGTFLQYCNAICNNAILQQRSCNTAATKCAVWAVEPNSVIVFYKLPLRGDQNRFSTLPEIMYDIPRSPAIWAIKVRPALLGATCSYFALTEKGIGNLEACSIRR